MLDFKILPDEFERCWMSGHFTGFALLSLANAVQKQKEAMSKPMEDAETPDPEIGGRNSQKLQAADLIDQDTLLQQINLDKKFNGR